jgi:hypothetical protein
MELIDKKKSIFKKSRGTIPLSVLSIEMFQTMELTSTQTSVANFTQFRFRLLIFLCRVLVPALVPYMILRIFKNYYFFLSDFY